MQVNCRVAARLVEAARVALPTDQAVIARQILQADLALLTGLNGQIAAAEERVAALLPATEYHVLTTTPGWGLTRAAEYAATLGPHARWPSAAKVYLQQERRASGVCTLPVALDDVLMAFDDERAVAALTVMAELSRSWQVILFTHQVHLADLAESRPLAGLTVSRLGGAPPMEMSHTADEIRTRARAAAPALASLGVTQTRPPRVLAPARAGSSGPHPGAVREWARTHGYVIGERGRIPADVIAAYENAHR